MRTSPLQFADCLGRIPFYFPARALGNPPPLPLSLALCVTHRCNADCLTCNIASRPANEMSIEEWRCVFRSFGRKTLWFTITGGEPFLRGDMTELLEALLETCVPAHVTIATNGSLIEAVLEAAEICNSHQKTKVALNVSIDGPREAHDRIRGRVGAYDTATETLRKLSETKPRNLRLGVHTVISRHNVDFIPELVDEVGALGPDSHFFEIAQPRAELAMEGANLAPDPESMRRALTYARRQLDLGNGNVEAALRLVSAFRKEYYHAVESSLCDGGRMPPCYAGVASAYVSPDGTLTACPNRREEMGRLRGGGIGFKKLWHSRAAAGARRAVRKEDCRCTLANAAYTSMMFRPTAVFRSLSRMASSMDIGFG
ncbi:MAG: radical SAM protein [bacterium]